MSFGVIDGISEVVQWKIPDFFAINKNLETWIDSPRFLFEGRQWNIRVYPKGNKVQGYTSAYLRMNDPSTVAKTLIVSFGIKTKDSMIEGKTTNFKCTFKEGKLSWGWGDFWDLNDLKKRKSELVPFGALTITCRVERGTSILKEVARNPEEVETAAPDEVSPNPEKVDSQQTMLVELEALSSDLEDLFRSERKYDVTVNVQGEEFRAHRIVLSARSPVFRAIYDHDTAESKSGVLTIPDCDPNSFGDFLRYLYTGRMKVESFWTAYHLYATAEKYDIQRLKVFCTDCMSQNLTAENVCDVVILADHFGDEGLMASAQEFFNENSTQILLTPDWRFLLKSNIRLVDKLLSRMAASKSC